MTNKDYKELREICSNLDDPVNVHFVVNSSICYFLLESPKTAEELSLQMYKDFETKNMLKGSTVHSPQDLVELNQHGLGICKMFKMVEERQGKYFLTEKGFGIGKMMQEYYLKNMAG